MDLSWSLVVSACIGLIFVGLGGIYLLRVPTRKNQKEATDRILSKRVFEDIDKVQRELKDYFVVIVLCLNKANLCFFAAFLILFMTIAGLHPDMPILQVMLRIVPFALIPNIISRIAKNQARKLWWSCQDKLNEG